MGVYLLYICMAATALAAIYRPWIGVVAAYVFVVLTPQCIWYWDFAGIRPVFWTLVPTLLGIIIAFVRGDLDITRLMSRQSLFILTLWFCFVLSSFAGPYVNVNVHRVFQVAWVRGLVDNIFLLYFAAILLIDSEKKLKYLAAVMTLSTIYLIYWCNHQYLAHLQFGRIEGPGGISGGGTYTDQNAFAMLFVTGLPFLYYFGFYFANSLYRCALWLFLPLGWHAIFLTGSRGGLLGLCVTLLVITFRSSRKFMGVGLILLFVVAYQMEAGSLMKSRADTIDNYQHDGSAEGRIQAWNAAMKMIEDHPVTGVGLASFEPAFPHYSIHHPRATHNTFFQIAAESGLTAGITYLLMLFAILLDLWQTGSRMKREDAIYRGNFPYCLNEALLTAFIGFGVCAIFLPLGLYEMFYFMCAMAAALTCIVKRLATTEESASGCAVLVA